MERAENDEQDAARHRGRGDVGARDRQDGADEERGQVARRVGVGRDDEDAQGEGSRQHHADRARLVERPAGPQRGDEERDEQTERPASDEEAHACDRREHQAGKGGVRHGNDEERKSSEQDVNADDPGDRADEHRLEQRPLEERRTEAVDEPAHRFTVLVPRVRAERAAPAAPRTAKPAVSVSTTVAPDARRTPWCTEAS